MRIGVVIPTLGQNSEWLEASVKSAFLNLPNEIVLVLREPNSSVQEIANRYSSRIVIENKKGVYTALNRGISEIENDVEAFCFLGDDDLLEPNALIRLKNVMENSGAMAVFGSIAYVDENLQVLMQNKGYRFAVRTISILPNLIPNPGTLISVEAWQKCGGYDESLSFASDLDFWLKLRKIGKIQSIQEPISKFRWHSSSLTKGSRKKSLIEASLVRTRHTHKFLIPLRICWEPVITRIGEILMQFAFLKQRIQKRFAE
jgi:GT2 family glycosyltransferase